MYKSQGNILITIAFLLLIAILLAVTNPDKESHMQAISDNLAEKSTISNVLSLGFLALKSPRYYNMALFSYTRVSDRIASVGLLSYVWVNKELFN